MKPIVLKHLAREFNIDPGRLRKILRKKYSAAPQRRWTWTEKEAKQVRKFLSGIKK